MRSQQHCHISYKNELETIKVFFFFFFLFTEVTIFKKQSGLLMSLEFFPESIERDLTISFSSDFKSVNINSIVRTFIKTSWRYSKDSKWWKVRLQKSGKFEIKQNLLPIPAGDFKWTSSWSRYVICNLGWSSILMSDAEISKPFGKSCGFSLYNIDHKDDIHGSNAPSYLHKIMKTRWWILFETYYENNIISAWFHLA